MDSFPHPSQNGLYSQLLTVGSILNHIQYNYKKKLTTTFSRVKEFFLEKFKEKTKIEIVNVIAVGSYAYNTYLPSSDLNISLQINNYDENYIGIISEHVSEYFECQTSLRRIRSDNNRCIIGCIDTKHKVHFNIKINSDKEEKQVKFYAGFFENMGDNKHCFIKCTRFLKLIALNYVGKFFGFNLFPGGYYYQCVVANQIKKTCTKKMSRRFEDLSFFQFFYYILRKSIQFISTIKQNDKGVFDPSLEEFHAHRFRDNTLKEYRDRFSMILQFFENNFHLSKLDVYVIPRSLIYKKTTTIDNKVGGLVIEMTKRKRFLSKLYERSSIKNKTNKNFLSIASTFFSRAREYFSKNEYDEALLHLKYIIRILSEEKECNQRSNRVIDLLSSAFLLRSKIYFKLDKRGLAKIDLVKTLDMNMKNEKVFWILAENAPTERKRNDYYSYGYYFFGKTPGKNVKKRVNICISCKKEIEDDSKIIRDGKLFYVKFCSNECKSVFKIDESLENLPLDIILSRHFKDFRMQAKRRIADTRDQYIIDLRNWEMVYNFYYTSIDLYSDITTSEIVYLSKFKTAARRVISFLYSIPLTIFSVLSSSVNLYSGKRYVIDIIGATNNYDLKVFGGEYSPMGWFFEHMWIRLFGKHIKFEFNLFGLDIENEKIENDIYVMNAYKGFYHDVVSRSEVGPIANFAFIFNSDISENIQNWEKSLIILMNNKIPFAITNINKNRHLMDLNVLKDLKCDISFDRKNEFSSKLYYLNTKNGDLIIKNDYVIGVNWNNFREDLWNFK